ncbi:MAG TPA: hypothetical protein ENI85_01035 [Deltaproteobacteria bacterium]|nr:hypothetical protein [Deltaproteobacteria bacterium]
MPSKSIVVALVIALASIAGVTMIVRLRFEIERGRQRLEEAISLNRRLSERLALLEAGPGKNPPGARGDVLECPTLPAECPDPVEVILTPEGRRLTGPGEREAWVRSRLAERLERARLEGRLAEDQSRGALDLLMRFRELRSSGGSPEALHRTQEELIDLTGMGVGELLETLEDSEKRARRPGEIVPIAEGEERKRFLDETARRLGITQPGSVERLRDGEWRVDATSPSP